jgi:hypothetical protein
MHLRRLLGSAAVVSIAAAPLLATTTAGAQVANVSAGRADVGATLLAVDVGDGALSVRVLDDVIAAATGGAPGASTSLSPLHVSSSLAPGLAVDVPPVSTSSTGAEDKKDVSPALPTSPAFGGSLHAVLSSVVDAAGARSGLDATLSDLSLAGGLASLPSGTVSALSDAATGSASASRTISIPSIEVLNLAAVLDAVGAPLANLPIDDLLALLGGLGIDVPDLSDPAAAIAELDAAIELLQGQTGALTAAICQQVDGILDSLGGLAGTSEVGETVDTVVEEVAGGTPIGDVVDDVLGGLLGASVGTKALPVSCSSVTGTVNDLIDDLQAVVADVLSTALSLLADTSLLSVEGVEVGMVARSAETLEGSLADVTGTIGSVTVGNLAVPGVSGLDLTAATGVLAAAGDAVTAAVADVLSLVDANLADLVDVDVLDIVEDVAHADGVTNAVASVTALKATINPVGLLGVAALEGTVGSVLTQLGGTVPAIAPVVGQLEAALGGVELLGSASTITVGQLSSTSQYQASAAQAPTPTSPSAPTPTGQLPRTGSEDVVLPAMAVAMLAAVTFAIRRRLEAYGRS